MGLEEQAGSNVDAAARQAFADQMIEALRSSGETRSVVYEPDHFELRVEGEESPLAYLGNVYADYSVSPPERRREVVQEFVDGIFDVASASMPDEFEEANPRLRVALRPKIIVPGIRSCCVTTARRPVSGTLLARLVLDAERSMRDVDAEDLERWGVSDAQAWDAATRNLRASARGQRCGWKPAACMSRSGMTVMTLPG